MFWGPLMLRTQFAAQNRHYQPVWPPRVKIVGACAMTISQDTTILVLSLRSLRGSFCVPVSNISWCGELLEPPTSDLGQDRIV